MKHRSSKTAAIYRKWNPIRFAFLEQFPFCMVCGTNYSAYGMAVHEMTPGANRMLGFVERATWLSACGLCNCEALTDSEKWPIASQLALKLYYDPAHFDLVKVNQIFGCNKVSAQDVLDAFAKLHAGRYFAA